MDFTDSPQVMNYVIENELMNTSKYTSEQSYFATSSLSKLQNAIHQKGNISFFLEEGEELDKVLQIFIRINSGGTKLQTSVILTTHFRFKVTT